MIHPRPTGPRRHRWRWAAAVATGLVVAGLVASSPAAWATADDRAPSAAASADVSTTTDVTTATSSTAPAKTSLAVQATPAWIRQGSPVTLHYALSSGGAPVAGALVSLTYAGRTTRARLDANGQGSFVVKALPGGRQKLAVTYAGDDSHAASSGSASVTVATISTVKIMSATPIAPGVPARIAVRITSGGVPVSGAIATLTYSGKSINTPKTDAQGVARLTVANLPGGRNPFVARYAGDTLHLPAAASLAIVVHAPSAIGVVAAQTTLSAGVPVKIGWKLTTAGRPVANAPVTITAQGSTIKATGQADGRGSAMVKGMTPGTVKALVAYAGDAGHGAVTGSVTLTVIGSSSITASVSPATATPDRPVTVSFRVTSKSTAMRGHAVVSYGGVSRTVSLDAAGRGSLTIAGGTFATGAHPITVSWAGSTFYTRSSRSVTVTMVTNTACPAWATACVDLTNNTTWLQSGGKITYGPVPMSSGRPGYRTPAGTYVVYWKDKDHVSSIYDASMPNAVFFNGGVAFHEGSVYVESHGCIHLTWAASQKYWDTLHYGSMVVVFGYARY